MQKGNKKVIKPNGKIIKEIIGMNIIFKNGDNKLTLKKLLDKIGIEAKKLTKDIIKVFNINLLFFKYGLTNIIK